MNVYDVTVIKFDHTNKIASSSRKLAMNPLFVRIVISNDSAMDSGSATLLVSKQTE